MNKQPNNNETEQNQPHQLVNTPIRLSTSKQAVTQQPNNQQNTHKKDSNQSTDPFFHNNAYQSQSTVCAHLKQNIQINQQTPLISSQNEINLKPTDCE